MIVKRNKPEITDSQRPALVLLDGTEEARESQSKNSMAPLVMDMRPVVLVFTKAAADDAGSSLNDWRRRLIAAVCSDAPLLTILGASGEIHYDGCETGFARAEQVACDMALTFAVKYVMNPSKLEATDKREDILAALLTVLENTPTSSD